MAAPITARKDGTNIIHCIAPDVCLTPPQPVPVPYMSISFLNTSTRVSRSVRDNGKKDFQLNSRPTKTTGHEPGTKKGVKVPGHKSHSLAVKGAATVFSEGFAEIRDGDKAEVNRPGPGGTEPKRAKKQEELMVASSKNQRENKQFKAAVASIGRQIGRPLSMEEQDRLHRIISKGGMTYQDIINIGIAEFGG